MIAINQCVKRPAKPLEMSRSNWNLSSLLKVKMIGRYRMMFKNGTLINPINRSMVILRLKAHAALRLEQRGKEKPQKWYIKCKKQINSLKRSKLHITHQI